MNDNDLMKAITERTHQQLDACVASIGAMSTSIPSLSTVQARAVVVAVLSTPWVADSIALSLGIGIENEE